jgi:hypothetical protein
MVSIHQPSYFPWLGLLDKINKSKEFILLDSVQLSDSTYQNRNIFLDNSQKEHLLTIAINKKNYQEKDFSELTINNNNIWQKKHQKFIMYNYKKHPYFDEIYPLLETFYKNDYEYLIDPLFESMKLSMKIFGINVKIQKSSSLNLSKENTKDKLVLDILEKVHAKEYLSGQGAKNYQDDSKFKDKNIILHYQEFEHPVYPQYKKSDFHSGLSCLDAAFNLGISDCSKLLKEIK